MSGSVRLLTILLLILPVAMAILAIVRAQALAIAVPFIIAVYSWVWLRFRPSGFVARRGNLVVVWPLKRQEIPASDIKEIRLLDRQELKQEIGWGMRVGAGGLWGTFGRLWTKHRGLIHVFASRLDRFVWIELASDKPWLITPDQPEAFVEHMSERR